MRPDELPWAWIVVAALAAAGLFVALRSRGGRREGRGRASRGYGSAAAYDPALDPGTPQTGEQRALLTAANAVRDALDRQAREMGELRGAWSRRLDEMERKIDALAQSRESVPERRAEYGDYGGVYDSTIYGAESPGRPLPDLEPAWSPGPGDQPVEVRDGVLVASRSLPPPGYLSARGAGEARVYLNADVQLTEFSLPKWAAFFDLQGAKPYAAYRTLRPAEVRWEEGAGRGELISKGLAEAI